MQHDQYQWNNSLSRSYPKHFWQGEFAPWKQVWGLQLRACDDQDCIECIEWIYTIDNIDSTPMTITIVDHTHNGITDSLIDQLPTTNLAVGESTGLNETQKVNICIKQLITTLINAEANPPAGLPCFDSNMYALQTKGPCLVDAIITCTQDSTGIECNEITPPVKQCATGKLLETVSFVYKYSTCAEESNEQDNASSCKNAEMCAITPESTVDINFGNLFSGTVMEGNEITISAPDGTILPIDITSMICPSGRDICQTITVNTSGNVNLQLKDIGGAKNSNELYLFYMRLILFPVKF
jgi:hypothetical protein